MPTHGIYNDMMEKCKQAAPRRPKRAVRAPSLRSAGVLLILLVCTVFSAASLCGCAAKMTDAEAREILSGLVPLSQELNEIFFGDGLPLEDENAEPMESVSGGQYLRVAKDAKYQSVDEIKAAAESVYTAEYLQNSVYPMAFDGVDDARPRYAMRDGVLCRNLSSVSFTVENRLRFDEATVSDTGYDVAELSVPYEDADGNRSNIKITLRRQNGKWLLDTPTY